MKICITPTKNYGNRTRVLGRLGCLGALLLSACTTDGSGQSESVQPLSAVLPVGSSVRHRCVGATVAGETGWRDYRENRPGLGIVATIDTSACGYKESPIYTASIGGRNGHWSPRGATSIYNATNSSFEIFLKTSMTAEQANNTQDDETRRALAWSIQWEAHPEGNVDPFQCAGQTTPGKTAWESDGRNGLVLRVDTRSCAFDEATTPSYFTALGGASGHWMANGHTAILDPSSTGFSIRVPNSGLSADEARALWHLNWNATAANINEHSMAVCTGRATGWRPYSIAGAYYMDIDSSDCGFKSTPRYFTSLGGKDSSFVTGSNAIYFAKPNGFRVYVRSRGADPRDLKLNWKAVPQPKKPALWVWEDDSIRMLYDASYATDAIKFIKTHGFGTVYLYAGEYSDGSYTRSLRTDPLAYDTLIRQFHGSGIQVHALLGSERIQSESWALELGSDPDYFHKRAVKAVQEVADYNRFQAYPGWFDGIQLAVLPHRTDAWHDIRLGAGREKEILAQYLRMAEKVMNAADSELTGPIGAAVPWWWSHVVEFGGVERKVYEHTLELYDDVTLLAFQDYWASIKTLAERPIAYAELIGKPITVGVETRAAREFAAGENGKLVSAEHITFCEEGPDALKRQLAQAGSQAIAIHDFRWFQSLVDEFVDENDRKMFPEEREERCEANIFDVPDAEEVEGLDGVWIIPAKRLPLSGFGFVESESKAAAFIRVNNSSGFTGLYRSEFQVRPQALAQTVYALKPTRGTYTGRILHVVIDGFGPDHKKAVLKLFNLRNYVLLVTEEAAATAGEFRVSATTTSPAAAYEAVVVTEWVKSGKPADTE